MDFESPGVISGKSVRRLEQAVLVDVDGDIQSSHGNALTLTPLIDEDRVAGMEIRCGCGAHAIVECVYTGDGSKEGPTR